MKAIFKIVLLSIFVLMSCAPSTSERDFSQPLMNLKPNWENDPEFAKLQQNIDQFEMAWSGQIPTYEVHDVIQGMLDIAEGSRSKNMQIAAASLYKKYYAQSVGTRVSFFRTPYYEVFQNEALPSVRHAIVTAQKQIGKDLEEVKRALKKITNDFHWPEKAKYRETVILINHFLNTLVAAVPKLKLLPEFEAELIKEINEEKKVQINYLNGQWSKIDGEKTLKNMLMILQDMVKEFDIALDKASLAKIESGKVLAVEIDGIVDEVTAFRAIVMVWLALNVNEREKYFAPISDDLYKFLAGRTDADLKCLITETCFKFLSAIIRDLGVLPQIKKFGVGNIQKALNENTHSYVLEVLEERLLGVAKTLDMRVESKIEKNVVKAKARLENTRRNAQGFTKDKFLVWLKKNFNFRDEMTLGYELNLIQVDAKKKVVTFKVPKQNQSVVSARNVGASLAANSKIFAAGVLTEMQMRKPLIEQINRIMGFGGLPSASTRIPTKGIVKSFENSVTPFNIENVVSTRASYGIVNNVELSGAYLRRATTEPAQISATAQIDLGNGLLATMKYLRDWESSTFDKSLGGFKASSVFGSDAGGGSATDPLMFSKTIFFGMTTAQFINWTLNLTKDFSQVGLITDHNEVLWLNEFSKNRDKTVLFGAYVDVINGQRMNEVNLMPMVKLIRLLKSVESVVTGIEKTKFPQLLEKAVGEPECVDERAINCPTLAKIIARRVGEIKQILIPLGNTIATKFRKKKEGISSGTVFGTLSLPMLEPMEKEITLMDQLYAIEGLLAVYEFTHIETYLWAAKETFFNLQKIYNPKTNFFDMKENGGKATIPEVIQMIRTFKLMTPYLEEDERVVLNKKVKIWEYSLEMLR